MRQPASKRNEGSTFRFVCIREGRKVRVLFVSEGLDKDSIIAQP